MARGRMINQTIAEDLEFNDMSVEAQLMYLRTIPHLDRDGLINGHPFVLFGKVAPLMVELADKMTAIIQEWIDSGLVISYQAGKVRVLFFKGFTKNQQGMRYDREAASLFPMPPGYDRGPDGLYPVSEDKPNKPKQGPRTDSGAMSDDSGKTPELLRQNSGTNPAEVNRIESNTTTTVPTPKPEIKQNGSGGSGLPLHRNRQQDTDYARICGKFEDNGFGMLTQMMAEEINALMDEFPTDWIDEAMTIAVGANKRQLRYAKGILLKWRADGKEAPKKTVSAADKWKKAFDNSDEPEYLKQMARGM